MCFQSHIIETWLNVLEMIMLAVKDDKVHDSVLKSHVLAMSGTTIEQGSKIGLGQTKNVAVVFAKFQVNRFRLIALGFLDCFYVDLIIMMCYR
jgi:Mitogen-activated protein kinase kinase 1 interacting